MIKNSGRIYNASKHLITGVLIVIALAGCKDNFTPKPRGFFRIDMPERAYKQLDSIFPYKFEYPKYSRITNDPHSPHERYWINVDFPRFKGRLHLSYKAVNNNLSTFSEDAHSMVMKHIPKASAIEELKIENAENKVYGLVYDIQGTGAASPFQFYLTDSSKHFVRGALYFSTLPNNDSLAPVIDFLKEDIMHMLETMEWK